MQHKSVLFLISLSQNKILEIEEKGVDYQLFLRTIRAYSHVEVHETISEDLISTASLYEVVVIVGHQVDGCIEMGDGLLFPMEKIASALHHYTGYIHVAVCGSSVIRDAIKQGSPDSRLRTSKQSTQLELQLLIYSLLLKRTDLNKNTFDYWYEFEWNFIKEIQERKDPADLVKLPCATKLGEESSGNVKTSVFFPEEVVRGEFYKLQIILHLDVDTGTLYFDIAKGNDPGTAKRKTNVALKNVQKGDRFLLNLSFLDGENRRPTEQIIVDERDELTFENDYYTKAIIVNDEDKTEITIHVTVNKDYNDSKFFTIIKFIKDDKCLMTFDLETGFKAESFYNDSTEEGKRPIVKGVKSGFSDIPNIKEQIEKTKQEKMYEDTHKDEKMCSFVHYSLGDEEGWQIHDEIKRLVSRQGIQVICKCLEEMRKEKKIILPQYNPLEAYKELVRMGMPNGEGFNESTFRKYYNKYCFKE